MTVQPNAQSLEAAARVTLEERLRGFQSRWDDPDVSQSFRNSCTAIAQAAITAFLSAERARGVELRPREPSAEMVVSGIAERHGQPVPEAWSLATENIWRAMWDAGAKASSHGGEG